MAGNAKHPVANLPERDLRLLKTRDDLESPRTPCAHPSLTPGSAKPGDAVTPGNAKPGDQHGEDRVEPTQPDEVQSPATTVPGEPERRDMPPPPPPDTSSSLKTVSPSPSTSKAWSGGAGSLGSDDDG